MKAEVMFNLTIRQLSVIAFTVSEFLPLTTFLQLKTFCLIFCPAHEVL